MADVTLYVEIIPDRFRRYMPVSGCHIGKTWKRRPDPEAVAPSAIVVEVSLDVPKDRLEHVVRATVESAEPVR